MMFHLISIRASAAVMQRLSSRPQSYGVSLEMSGVNDR